MFVFIAYWVILFHLITLLKEQAKPFNGLLMKY